MVVNKLSFRFATLVIAIAAAVAAGAYITDRASAASFGLFAPAETVNVFDVEPPAAFAPGTCDTAGPIEVEGSILGTTPTAYPTLAAAFVAINGGVHTGDIAIDVCGNTDEGTATATLNASGTGSASYTTITISPAGGAARTISGATNAGNPLIDLNGADNVTIDGLNTGGSSLTIANTTVSATSGTSTIRFIGGATNNTITNSNIQGSGTMSVATNGATIFFSTDAVTANGNDNNTISNNDIGPAGANLPTKAILGNGSTTTTAIGNSGIVINNNNIFDYFGAAVTSSGVATNGGCNTWSITNNRFYQTGTRTWTTGAIHRAIDIGNTSATNGAQGFTITGNTIGFSSSLGTGTYTLTGSTGKFQGIVFNGITGGAVSNINSNTIQSVLLSGVTSSGTSTSSPFTGILINNGLATTNSNSIGGQGVSGGSLTFSTNTTNATDVHGIFNFSFDITNAASNNIGGITVTNAAASGTFVFYGIRLNTGTTVAGNLTSNLVGGTVANSIQLNATGTASQMIGIQTSNAPAVFTSNTVRNLTTNIGTGTTIGASVIGINITSSTPNHTLSQNTIHTLTNTNATAASVVTGIQFTGSTANVVERNLIYNLLAPTTNTGGEISGIRIAGGTTQYRNNMIALGANQATALGNAASNSAVSGINGINEALGTNQFFHNSVYIGGTATSGAGASYAFNGTVTTNTRSNRDNIYFNARTNSGGTGTNYAIKYNGGVPNPTGLTVNNNVYFANGTGGVFGYFNGADRTNLAAWRTAVGQDLGSFESNPQFNAPTAATPDLHLHPTNPTVAEGNGVDVGVVLDFDGQTRSGLTPVDIGADAGNFVGIDLAPPVISYTPLGNTSSTSNRTQSATITDVTGVNTTVTLGPRIYISKNAAPYVGTTCTQTGGTPQNGTWDCEINYTTVGGVVAGDQIRYFIVAQDTVGNVGANPNAGFAATDVNNISSTPTNPVTYNIVGSVSGSYDVGTGETYTSLTNPGGIFEYINNNEVTGDVTINITTDLAGETGTHALNEFASPFTVLIKPSAGPRTITGSNANGLIKLNGADRVRIDGSSAASVLGGNASLREMTITNTGSGAIIWIGTNATSGANNNSIQNLNLVGPGSFAGQGILAGSGATLGNAAENGRPNSNNAIRNNSCVGVQNCVFTSGDAVTRDQNWVISENDFGSTTVAQKLSFRGVFVSGADNFQITENRISGIASSTGTSATMSGIQIAGVINGGLIARNEIKDIRQNNTVGWGSNGLLIGSTSSTSGLVIANNFISDIRSQGFNGFAVADNGYGVAIATGGGYNVYNNTVVMDTNQTTVGGHSSNFLILATVVAGGVDLRNNIIVNTQTIGNRYGIIDMGTTAAAYSALDYNLYHNPTGANFGRLNSVNHATLAAWQGATARDANSLSGDPLFVSPTDLHITNLSPAFDTGVTIAGVSIDIDGDARPQGAAYDIGADEVLVTPQYLLTVTPAGTGTGLVTSSPAGINCGGDCTELYDENTVVTLTAVADMGSVFTGWSGGGCAGTGTCIVTMSQARNVTATFDLIPPSPTPTPITEVQFAAATFMDDESQSALITVTRTGDLTVASSVDVVITDNTATGGATCGPTVDYVYSGPINVSFPISSGSQSFSVPLCSDMLFENTESADLSLTNNVGADIGTPSTATLMINDTANQWRNTTPIDITLGNVANPYPSSINVTGAPASVGSIRVTLYDFYHEFPDNVDILLVGPNGNKYVLMADVGGPGPGIQFPNHVTLTFSDIAAQTVPDSTAPTTGNYKPTNCETPVLAFAPPAPGLPYTEPGCALIRPVEQSMFGQFGLADGNGVWSLYIRDDAGTPLAPDTLMGEILGGWGLQLLPPTSTSVTVSGRVTTSEGAGLRNAVVSMTDSLGIKRTVTTSSLGYYVFTDIPVGDTYIVGVSSRRYRFTTRLVPVLDPISDLDFIGQE
ncbi:MAG: hypothetical protein IPM50_07195 [Acidobacteriota bacterium]|nr:MAG: hypothetical protein IPM50_07195 [Acidobacteriota bacterium]